MLPVGRGLKLNHSSLLSLPDSSRDILSQLTQAGSGDVTNSHGKVASQSPILTSTISAESSAPYLDAVQGNLSTKKPASLP